MSIPIETDLHNQRVIIEAEQERKLAAIKSLPQYETILRRIGKEYPDCDVPVCMDVVVRRAGYKWSQYESASYVASVVVEVEAAIQRCNERIDLLERAKYDPEARTLIDLGATEDADD